MNRNTSIIAKYTPKKTPDLLIRNRYPLISDLWKTPVILYVKFQLENQKTLNEINKDGLVQIVSKNQGWITVNTEK